MPRRPTALRPSELEALVAKVLGADTAAIAEALSRMEDARPKAVAAQRELVARLEAAAPAEHTVVGLTGPPGAGKSSLVSALIRHWCAGGAGVGVVAVDPTSRRSGGALLGDRARMQVRPGDRVFVRSMASRLRLGGLAPATRASVAVLRAVFSWVVVETVGVGQSEIEVESLADSVVLMLPPGSGDTLQFMKAGILEIPDVFVVHKWDLGAVAEQTRGDLESILRLRAPKQSGWSAPVLGVSAQTGAGVDELADALGRHRRWLAETGERERRRARSRAAWALELFAERYGALGFERVGGPGAAERLVRETAGTALDAFSSLATRAGLEPLPDPA